MGDMKFEPVRFSAALSVFGTAVIALVAAVFAWPALVVGLVLGVWNAGIALFNSFVVRESVTPNAEVNRVVHDTIIALAPSAPVVVSGESVPGIVTSEDVVAVLPDEDTPQR